MRDNFNFQQLDIILVGNLFHNFNQLVAQIIGIPMLLCYSLKSLDKLLFGKDFILLPYFLTGTPVLYITPDTHIDIIVKLVTFRFSDNSRKMLQELELLVGIKL